jgi:rod shape-determining protein MreC
LTKEEGSLIKIFSNQGKSWLSFKAFVLMLVSVCVMLSAHYSAAYRDLYTRLSGSVYPVRKFVDVPFQIIHNVHLWGTSRHELIQKNKQLSMQLLQLQAQSQELLALKKENTELYQLLKSKTHIPGHVTVAKLLAIHANPVSQEAFLNKGMRDNVYVGQPVLDGYGIFGQIVDTAPFTSKVLLITDPRFAVPVQNYRTHMKAIATGSGKNNVLHLIHVLNSSDIKKGDLFVTSGLALRFPMSYPVGVVTEVSRIASDNFLRVTLTPAAHVMRSSQVLLTWPAVDSLQPLPDQQQALT